MYMYLLYVCMYVCMYILHIHAHFRMETLLLSGVQTERQLSIPNYVSDTISILVNLLHLSREIIILISKETAYSSILLLFPLT